MSVRQIKRLEKQRCGGESGSDSEELPSTMLRPQQRRKAAKAKKLENKLKKQVEEAEEEEEQLKQEQQAPLAEPDSTTSVSQTKEEPVSKKKETKPKASQKINRGSETTFRKDHEDVGQEDSDGDSDGWLVGGTVSSAAAGKKPKQLSKREQKAQQKRKKQQQEEEDEALLNEQLTKIHGKEAAATLTQGQEGDGVVDITATTEPKSAMDLLTKCMKNWLDPREERIRAFGRAAVESSSTTGANQPAHMVRRGPAPKFRDTPFATADPKTWAPFSSIGLKLSRKGKIAGGVDSFVVDDTSDEYQAAQKKFERLVASFGDVNELVRLYHSQPYHIPTLLQLHSTLMTMGQVMEAQTFLEMALYTVGYIFVTSGFNISAGNSSRVLLYKEPSNQLVYLVLQRGIHQALKKGCGRTALEMTKFLLSLDDSDPKHVLLNLDYCALRGAQFEWLVQFHDMLEKEQSPLAALPSVHYNSALAAFLLQQKEEKAGTSGTALTTKTPRERLCDALRLFPNAAIALGEKLNENVLSGEAPAPWADWLMNVEGYKELEEEQALKRVSELFAERSHDVWRPAQVLNFLKQGLSQTTSDSDDVRAAAKQRRERYLAAGVLFRYSSSTPEEIMGETGTAIPQELLQDEATAEEMRAFQNQQARGLPPDLADRLQRMQAAFGELDPSMSPEEQLATYQANVEESMERLGERHSPLALFLRTLLPWGGNAQDMAVEQAMADRGVEDPTVEARRRRREERAEADRQFVEAAEREDQEDDDEDEWVDE